VKKIQFKIQILIDLFYLTNNSMYITFELESGEVFSSTIDYLSHYRRIGIFSEALDVAIYK